MKEPKDPRSTGRKRARKVLEGLVKAGLRKYVCEYCGLDPIEFPAVKLQAHHKNKNILDNDPVNLAWICPQCHKNEDKLTEKGVSPIVNEFGYGSY